MNEFETMGFSKKTNAGQNDIENINKPKNQNGLPSGFPPKSEVLSKDEFYWRSQESMMGYGGNNHYPEIGTTNLLTEYGLINGKLIWCDFDIAIFETPEGYISMKFKKLVGPSGMTYEQAENEEKKRNELPSNFPLGSERISDEKFEYRMKKFPSYTNNEYKPENYPMIGVDNLTSENGLVGGVLIWYDNYDAIFETPLGKIIVPFEKIISPSGETYGAIREREQKLKDDQRRKDEESKPKVMYRQL